jgi:hypothetical protein
VAVASSCAISSRVRLCQPPFELWARLKLTVNALLATYSLIDEKQIAISFVRKELVGAQYLEALRRESFLHKKWRHPCCHLRRT